MTLHFDADPRPRHPPSAASLLACRSWGIDDADAFALLAGSSPGIDGVGGRLAAIAAACADAGVDPHDPRGRARRQPRRRGALDAYLADHGWRVVTQYSPRGPRPDRAARTCWCEAIRAAATSTAPRRAADVGPVRDRVPAADRARFDDLLDDARASLRPPRRQRRPHLHVAERASCAGRCSRPGRRLAERGAARTSRGTCSPSARPRSPPPSPATRRLRGGRGRPHRPRHGRRGRRRAGAARRRRGPATRPGALPRRHGRAGRRHPPRVRARAVRSGRAPGADAWSGDGHRHRHRRPTPDEPASPPTPRTPSTGSQDGDVLVTTHTTPAFEAVMPIAGAARHRERRAHEPRRPRLPRVRHPRGLGVAGATTHIPDGATVTVDPATGRVTIGTRAPVGPT